MSTLRLDLKYDFNVEKKCILSTHNIQSKLSVNNLQLGFNSLISIKI